MNDGLYHSFSCLYCENAKPIFNPLTTKKDENNDLLYINLDLKYKQKYKSIIYGPTTKQMDLVAFDYLLPEIDMGDWFYIEEFGAYTISLVTKFNGIDIKQSFYYWYDV